MTQSEIREIVTKQRAYFESGATLETSARIEALKRLYEMVDSNEKLIQEALKSDLGKSAFESDMCEVRLTLSEISYLIRHVSSFAKEHRVRTPLAQFHSRSYRQPSPFGTVLIMSPWNYPVLLTLDPLADAIAAGNTCILKPSAYSPATSALLKELLGRTFPPQFISVIEGGRAENTYLLDEKFDYIFFTGSKSVGKEVMRKASEHLTPVTLELGGKSPCLIEKSANLALAARRLVFGKYLNVGQTCVAPDYVLVQEECKEELVRLVKAEIVKQYTATPLENPDYGKIINSKHFERVLSLIDEGKVVHGGRSERASLRIEPTVLDNVTLEDPVMQEEIFGPIMPILTYRTIEEAVGIIKSLDHPLAFYIFTKDGKLAKQLIRTVGFGGGCINDVVIHLATTEMPFGGFAESGMGSYHGKAGFDTFTHYKSIVDKKTWIDLPMRYAPYTELFHKLIRFFLK